MKLYETLKPDNQKVYEKKYVGQFLIWSYELADLRSGDYSHVPWNDGAKTHVFPVSRILDAVDNRRGEKKGIGKKYFIVLKYSDLTEAATSDVTQQNISSRIASTIPGVEFEIFQSGDKYNIRRFGRTKTSTLTKSFDTYVQARNYLTTACSGAK